MLLYSLLSDIINHIYGSFSDIHSRIRMTGRKSPTGKLRAYFDTCHGKCHLYFDKLYIQRDFFFNVKVIHIEISASEVYYNSRIDCLKHCSRTFRLPVTYHEFEQSQHDNNHIDFCNKNTVARITQFSFYDMASILINKFFYSFRNEKKKKKTRIF